MIKINKNLPYIYMKLMSKLERVYSEKDKHKKDKLMKELIINFRLTKKDVPAILKEIETKNSSKNHKKGKNNR